VNQAVILSGIRDSPALLLCLAPLRCELLHMVLRICPAARWGKVQITVLSCCRVR
jgi:hypothetical protein